MIKFNWVHYASFGFIGWLQSVLTHVNALLQTCLLLVSLLVAVIGLIKSIRKKV